MSTFSSPIQESLQDAVVLITGGTGYLGSGLVEKLLRSTPIKEMYLLIRPKKNKNVEERLEELFEGHYWKTVKTILPNYRKYIKIINGDLHENDLGLSEHDKQIIMDKVTHIFHLAATIRFDEKLKKAVAINILATKFFLDLALNCQRLKSFVHVSTAYAHCYLSDLNETFYDPITNLDTFLEFCASKSERELDDLTPSIIKNFPNTYSFTKSMTEELVRKYEYKLPISMVRPSIVMGSWVEPVPGWVVNLLGPAGIFVGAGMGLVHAVYINSDMITDFVPVDMTANCIIAASWKNCTTNYKQIPIPIFNFVSSKRNPATWATLLNTADAVKHSYQFSQAVWRCFYYRINNKTVYKYLSFLLHTIPAHIADTGLKMTGKKPLFAKLFEKVHKLQNVLGFFTDRQWIFNDEKTVDLFESLNGRDQITYNFDIATVEWHIYIINFVRVVRIHILKDPLSTVPAAQKRAIKLNVIHYSVVFFIFLILFLIFYFLLNKIGVLF